MNRLDGDRVPTAEATLVTDSHPTSPAAKTPGMLFWNIRGASPSGHHPGLRPPSQEARPGHDVAALVVSDLLGQPV